MHPRSELRKQELSGRVQDPRQGWLFPGMGLSADINSFNEDERLSPTVSHPSAQTTKEGLDE